MATSLPSMTSYDPPGTSEGTPSIRGAVPDCGSVGGATVPAVRERMQRIRFFTAMAVGALVTEGLEDNPSQRDASPYLVWEWLIVEALMRKMRDDSSIWGVPGTLVTRRALDQYRYLDARSYLKTPRIFGFHGVYKRLAIHLGLVDVHLGPGPKADGLVNLSAICVHRFEAIGVPKPPAIAQTGGGSAEKARFLWTYWIGTRNVVI